MSLFELLLPNILNPILVSRLDGNAEAALLLVCLNNWVVESSDDEGWAHFTRDKLCEMTGLTENKIKVSERFLKKQEVLEVKTRKGFRFYRVNSSKVSDLSGFSLRPTFVEKVGKNAKAALLLQFYIEFYQIEKASLIAEIPSTVVKLSTGMDRSSQIYARDSLLGMNFLEKVGKKGKEGYFYVLNIDELVKREL